MAEKNGEFEDIFRELAAGSEDGSESNNPNADADAGDGGVANADGTGGSADAGKDLNNGDGGGDANDDSINNININNNVEPDELEELRKQNEQLLKLINSGFDGVVPKAKKEDKATEGNKPDFDIASDIGELDLEELLSDPKNLINLLQKVAKVTYERATRDASHSAAGAVSEVVDMRELVRDFYEDNNDLKLVKKTVSLVAKNVGAENPEMDMPKVLAEAAKRTRILLGMKAPVVEHSKERKTGKKPALPGSPGGRRSTPEDSRSKLAKEVHDLFDIK